MQESDTYLMIFDKGQEKCARDDLLIVSEALLGSLPESARAQVQAITDLSRLKRMIRCAAKATTWQQILDTR
jgi:hypothetical protein